MLTQPIVQPTGRNRYRLVEPYVYESSFRIAIPAGFVWNGASVPRLFWTISGVWPGGGFLGPSCIHDAFYQNGGSLPEGWTAVRLWTRHEVDVLFRRMMKEAGISWWQYHRAYWAVRLFGRWAWKAKE